MIYKIIIKTVFKDKKINKSIEGFFKINLSFIPLIGMRLSGENGFITHKISSIKYEIRDETFTCYTDNDYELIEFNHFEYDVKLLKAKGWGGFDYIFEVDEFGNSKCADV